jgi:hypothetical protein
MNRFSLIPRYWRRNLGLGSLLTLLVFSGGCGSGNKDLIRVRGKVTRGGKPVANLFLNFVPDKGRPSWALTDANGEYIAYYDKNRTGALPGWHTIFVTFKPFDPRLGGGRLKEPAGVMPIVAKYGRLETSPLRIEVRTGSQTFDFSVD